MEQFNGVTSFLDLSNIYGSTKERNLLLRGGDNRKDGLLVQGTRLNRFVMPTASDIGTKYPFDEKKCMANLPVTLFTGVGSSSSDGTEEFIAGDNRCMAQPTLLSLHNKSVAYSRRSLLERTSVDATVG